MKSGFGPLAFAVLMGGILSTWPREAQAAAPVDVEGGGVLGYGTNPSRGPNPLGVGLGIRAGVTFQGFYGGVSLTYYFGDSGSCGGGAVAAGNGVSLPPEFCAALPAEVSLSQRSVLYGVDLGYTLSIPRLKLLKVRPILEMGDAEIIRTGTLGSSDIMTAVPPSPYQSDNAFYVQPGLSLLLEVDAFFAGVDANLLLIPSMNDVQGVTANADGSGNLVASRRALVAFTAHGQIGLRF